MYATGIMKMSCCETEIAAGKSVKTLSGGGNELALGGTKLISGSDGKTVWRHTPWLSTHAAKGPQRPLRRLIQATMYQFTF
ncbi:hypothetical protein Bca52824_082827 [Brassica carinata]|uniref:Uncharacterized protein n=1 Tax=Brassica carinata TaxID=52824 RepID=A0A8X7TT98_BRACI|nr:hypothetical protein Bca52824_082827 [Brassica carinata]